MNKNYILKLENPPKLPPNEAVEQEILVQYLELKKIRFTHIANERKATAHYGAKLKRQGVKKGFPDLMIFLADEIIFIELKRVNPSLSKISKEQEWWCEYLNNLFYARAFIAYGARAVINFLEKLQKNAKNPILV